MSPSPRPVPISMSLPWRMRCCAAPAPEPHEPDTARPHTPPPTLLAGGAGKLHSKSGRLDVIRYACLISQWSFLRRCNRRNACEKCGLVSACARHFHDPNFLPALVTFSVPSPTRGCYEPAVSVGRVKPVGGFVFHSGRSSRPPPSDSPRNGFVAGAWTCHSIIRTDRRRALTILPVEPIHNCDAFHNGLYGRFNSATCGEDSLSALQTASML